MLRLFLEIFTAMTSGRSIIMSQSYEGYMHKLLPCFTVKLQHGSYLMLSQQTLYLGRFKVLWQSLPNREA